MLNFVFWLRCVYCWCLRTWWENAGIMTDVDSSAQFWAISVALFRKVLGFPVRCQPPGCLSLKCAFVKEYRILTPTIGITQSVLGIGATYQMRNISKSLLWIFSKLSGFLALTILARHAKIRVGSRWIFWARGWGTKNFDPLYLPQFWTQGVEIFCAHTHSGDPLSFWISRL